MELKHTYSVGTFVAKLTVSDGELTDFDTETIVVTKSVNNAPDIVKFDANPKVGVNTLTSTFNVNVRDADGDSLVCTLNFGDGTSSTKVCNQLNGIKHTYNVGTYTAVLSATDGEDTSTRSVTITVTREDDPNNAPVIYDFDANPKFGVDILTSTFDVDVRDADGDSLTCTLKFGDGTQTTNSCDALDRIKHTYGVGTFTAVLTATDGDRTVSESVTIKVIKGDDPNNAPVIYDFDANPKTGFDQIESTFDVDVRDADGDSLTCTLRFGDGTQTTNSCNALDGTKHTYNVGTFVAVLTATDGDRTVTDSVTITVTQKPNSGPFIAEFDANPKVGTDRLNSTFDIRVTDVDGDRVSCKLEFGDGTFLNANNCNNLDGISHVYTVGTYTAVLTADDGEQTSTKSVTIVVNEKPNTKPFIVDFDANPKNGFDEIESRFTVNVRDSDDDALTCTLNFGDGTQTTRSCDNLDGITNVYTIGVYTAVLTVTDGKDSTTDSVVITVNEKPNTKPFIVEFDANPKNGFDEITSIFDIEVRDTDGDSLTCTLNFGDGTSETDSCDDLDGIANDYTTGVYTAILTVSDGEDEVTDSVTITVQKTPNTAPEIREFDANPKFGINELESRFDVEVVDANGDALICTLNFGDGDSVTRSCDLLDGIVHDYTIGNYVATLTVSDGEDTTTDSVNIQVVEEPNIPPFVLRFNGVPDFGFDEIETEFEIVVTDDNGDDVLCTIDFGDGDFRTGECSALNRITHVYTVGDYTATLTATDGKDSVTTTERIRVVRQPNRAPVVNLFDADPKLGLDELTSTFTVQVTDADGDALSCNLAFGDGSNRNGSCESLNGIAHNYFPGSYVATLTASDGNLTTQSTVTIRVDESGMPVIDLLTLDSSNGFLAPTDLTIEWATSHTANRDMTCTLRVNNRNFAVPCDGTTTLADYNVEGTTTVTITAVDDLGKMASKSVQKKLVREENLLENIEANLIIDDVIVPGDFEFKIEIPDEPTKRRIVDITAKIVCDGVDIKAKQFASSGKLDSSLVSSNQNDRTMYKFTLNTLNDFIANIPKDEMCTFEVVIVDQYGSQQTLTEKVKFSYEEDEKRFVSIRGKGTDVINYMRSALLDGVHHGYNSIEFAVENNEADTKQLTVTVISRPLGIEFSETERITADEVETFQIPMYISNSVEPGMYEIRFSVYDGENHQTRYSYLTVHE